MQQAIKKLEMIEAAEWLLDFDKPMQKVSINNLQQEYADTMADLATLLLTQTNATHELQF